jgi:hypothetical protein
MRDQLSPPQRQQNTRRRANGGNGSGAPPLQVNGVRSASATVTFICILFGGAPYVVQCKCSCDVHSRNSSLCTQISQSINMYAPLHTLPVAFQRVTSAGVAGRRAACCGGTSCSATSIVAAAAASAARSQCRQRRRHRTRSRSSGSLHRQFVGRDADARRVSGAISGDAARCQSVGHVGVVAAGKEGVRTYHS